MEKRVNDLVREAQERNTTVERCQAEVIWVETLLTQRDLALNQARDDHAEARDQVSQWQSQVETRANEVKGNSPYFTFVARM